MIKQPVKYWPVLDGLRGVAFLLVWLSHLNPGAAGGWFAYGWIGVELFFVLSGFLITGILIQYKAIYAGLQGFYLHFLRNRILRIFPLYYLFLGWVVFLAILFRWPDLSPFLQRLPFYITYSQNYFHIIWPDAVRIKGLGHLWSLAIEEQFYLFWPFMVWLIPVRRLWIVAVFGLVFSLVLRIWMPAYPGMYVFTPMRLDGLMAGSLLAILYYIFPEKIVRNLGAYSSFLLIVAFAGSFLANAPTARHVYYAYAGYSLLALAFACLIGWLLTADKPWLAHILQHPWLIWLGKRAYGLYIFHLPVLFYGRQWLYPKIIALKIPFAADITLLLLNGLILVLAWASFRFFEKPFLRYKKPL